MTDIRSVRLKLKEKLAIIEEKYGDSGNNKEDARWYYLAPMLMDGVIYAKHWIEDICVGNEYRRRGYNI